MEEPHGALERIGRLVNTLSEMAAPYGYRIVTVSDPWELGLCVSDEKKTQAATLCVVMLGDSEESSAEALLRKYESKNSWTAFLCDGYEGLTFPGGTLEEIELKAAVGVKALLKSFDCRPEKSPGRHLRTPYVDSREFHGLGSIDDGMPVRIP